MSKRIETQQLFLNTQFGLQRAYSLLNKASLDGVSSDDFSNYSNVSLSDIPFVQFLQQNMTTTDTNKDKIISQEELNGMISGMQKKGFTYDQLLAMSVNSDYNNGVDKSLLDTVLANFKEIDINNDGKVSQTEVEYYNLNNEIEDKKTELTAFKASDISVFYGDSSDEVDAESLNETESEDTEE